MKLYYSPFACSLASHIACREAGLAVELQRTELATKRVDGGENLFTINPMGQVPTLVTDDGWMLAENTAVLTYLADRVPERRLAPAPGELARYELLRWLSFVGTEIHRKGLGLIFAPETPVAVKDYARSAIHRPLAVLDAHLTGRETLLGEAFSVADAYLVWALMLMRPAEIPLENYAGLLSYHKLHMARPSVQEAVAFEREQRERPYTP